MARLTRKNIKVFAGEASNNGVFGSLQANDPVTTNDVEQIQSLSAWGEGWNAATETSEKLPPLEEIQGVEYVTTYQQAYIMQEGLPEWATTVTYYKGSLVKEVTANGFRIYCSLTDNNTGNLVSDTDNWKKVMDSDDLYALDNTVVHKAGSETISGEKTFSVSPIVPTATAGDSSTKAANTAFVTTAVNNLQSQVNSNFVNLTGTQTITGVKTFNNNLLYKQSTQDFTTTPAQPFYTEIRNIDRNGFEIGQFRVWKDTDGANIMDLLGRYQDNSINNWGANLGIRTYSDGRSYPYASASDVNGSIVTTVNKSKGTNGYFKLGNGLIIQWGKISSSTNTLVTVTFPTPFTSTNYYAHSNGVRTDRGDNTYGYVSSMSTTGCKFRVAETTNWWIAIGY